MIKIEFKYDIFKDGGNLWRVLTTQPSFDKDDVSRHFKGLNEKFVEKFNQEENILLKQQITADYLSKFLLENKNFIEEKIQKFSQEWDQINDRYFKKLSLILDIDLSKNNNIYTCFLTKANSCPFHSGDGWFMVRLNDEKIVATAAHELMHIEFIKRFGYYCRDLGISPKQFGDLKEIITILLNEEMADILPRPDYGYKEHQEARAKVLELWRKDKILKNLIDHWKEFLK